MKKNTWLPILLAALVVLAVGTVLIAAETMTVKVKKTDDQQVEVDVNGVVETISIEDLAEGEERTFGLEDHEVTVRRIGDELEVLLNGEECGPGGAKGLAHAFAFATSEDGGEGEQRIVIRNAGKGEDMVWFGEGAMAKRIVVDSDGEEHNVIFLGAGEGKEAPHDMIIKTLGEHGDADRVRYRCAEDGTEIVLKKEAATQEIYMCPVCGRAMDKVEARTIEVFVHELETNEEPQE